MRIIPIVLALLLVAAFPAFAQDAAEIAQPEWAKTLSGPFIGGLIVSVLVQVLRAIPQVPVFKGPKVAAIAALLSVVVSFITAYASGDLSGFDAASAYNVLINFLVAITTATGAAESAGHASNALTPREAAPVFGPPVEGE